MFELSRLPHVDNRHRRQLSVQSSKPTLDVLQFGAQFPEDLDLAREAAVGEVFAAEGVEPVGGFVEGESDGMEVDCGVGRGRGG